MKEVLPNCVKASRDLPARIFHGVDSVYFPSDRDEQKGEKSK